MEHGIFNRLLYITLSLQAWRNCPTFIRHYRNVKWAHFVVITRRPTVHTKWTLESREKLQNDLGISYRNHTTTHTPRHSTLTALWHYSQTAAWNLKHFVVHYLQITCRRVESWSVVQQVATFCILDIPLNYATKSQCRRYLPYRHWVLLDITAILSHRYSDITLNYGLWRGRIQYFEFLTFQ